MMELRKIDPAKNTRRFYRLSVEPTLFGDFAVIRELGRIDAKGGVVNEESHVSVQEADRAFGNALISRLKRGYRERT